MNHVTWRMSYSKMSGEESPLKCTHTQDKTYKGEHSNLTKNSCKVSLLFQNSMCFYKRGDTLFIDMSALERKRGRVGV